MVRPSRKTRTVADGSDFRVSHQSKKLRRVRHRLSIERDDDVASPDAGLERLGIATHLRDQRAVGARRAVLARQVRSQPFDPEIADRSAPHFAVLLQFINHSTRQVARDREADSLVSAALAEDAGVDADHFAARVHQRTAGISRIDRRVGLNEVFVIGKAKLRPTGGADDAGGDRLTELRRKRAADRQHPLADLQLRRIAPWQRLQAGEVHLDQRDIGGRVDANDPSAHLTLVRERRRHFGGACVVADHVIVRHDVPVGAR